MTADQGQLSGAELSNMVDYAGCDMGADITTRAGGIRRHAAIVVG